MIPSWLREERAPVGPSAGEDNAMWRRLGPGVYHGAKPPSPRAHAWTLPVQWHKLLWARAQPKSASPQIDEWWALGCFIMQHCYGTSWQTEWELQKTTGIGTYDIRSPCSQYWFMISLLLQVPALPFSLFHQRNYISLIFQMYLKRLRLSYFLCSLISERFL